MPDPKDAAAPADQTDGTAEQQPTEQQDAEQQPAETPAKRTPAKRTPAVQMPPATWQRELGVKNPEHAATMSVGGFSPREAVTKQRYTTALRAWRTGAA